jgi:hypothetical protein
MEMENFTVESQLKLALAMAAGNGKFHSGIPAEVGWLWQQNYITTFRVDIKSIVREF